MDAFTRTQCNDFMHQTISDPAKSRVPWQMSKSGEFGDDVEPLDEGFIHQMMTGEKAPVFALSKKNAPGTQVQIIQFSSLAKADLLVKMQTASTLEDVCETMNIPVSAMLAFSSALNPNFDCKKDLTTNFKNAVISLLTNRTERERNDQPGPRLIWT
jgi:hypothetical protein